jgi:hypothetical protein
VFYLTCTNDSDNILILSKNAIGEGQNNMKSILTRRICVAILMGSLLIILPNLVQAATIRVEAYIDGRSQLILQGNTAQWYHLYAAEPGNPTVINSIDWYASWSGETRDCGGCYSSIFSQVCPGLGEQEQNVALSVIQARQSVQIIQQPLSGNNYTLIVEFDDMDPGGAEWYIIELDFPYDIPCSSVETIPTMTEWGMMIFVVLLGLGSVYYLRKKKRILA